MSEKKQVIFISDQFGYRCGGSNTFNIELCFALRQIAAEDVDLFSLVINCQENDRIARLEHKAEELSIKIVHQSILDREKGVSDNECQEIAMRLFGTASYKGDLIWIGHDIFTGQHAIRLAEFIGGESIVCIHTDYDTIEGLKGINNMGLIKERNQRDIIRGADRIFAIGPRLLERVREIRKTEIYELIPGMPSFDEGDIYNSRGIITYGRFEGNVAPIKQVQLAMAAFGRAVAFMNNNKDYVLHIIGTTTKEDEARLRGIAERYAGRKLSINFLKYTQEREQLYRYLKNNCAGLMLSLSEGFGMTGWEMISAGIPLILTKKSGLYDYLEERFGYTVNGMCIPVDLKGSSDERLCEMDVEAVAEKIVTVFSNSKKLKEAARRLRIELQDETWHKTAESLAEVIHIPTMDFRVAQIYSETYKTRQACIEELLNTLEIGEIDRRYLVFFGGISSNLCEERVRDQVILVRIKNEVQTYIIIADEDIYCTLLLETRSSEAMTMKINNKQMEEKRKLIENMEHIIKKQELGKDEKSLIEILELLKKSGA